MKTGQAPRWSCWPGQVLARVPQRSAIWKMLARAGAGQGAVAKRHREDDGQGAAAERHLEDDGRGAVAKRLARAP